MAIIAQLVRNITDTRFSAIPETTINHAKKRIIDIIGCALAGTRSPVYPAIMDLAKEWGGNPESTILAPGIGRMPMHNAAMVNGILASAFDFDPLRPLVEGKLLGGHISSTTISAALAVAEAKAASGQQLLTALVLGEDLTARIMLAAHYVATPGLTNGWSAESTMAIFGTAAIAGKLLGLGESQMHNAFGIALNQAAGTVQSLHEKSHCYKLNQGFGARNGILSAQLASRGFYGLADPLLGEYGYFALYCRAYDTGVLTRELGKRFYADHVLKQYPSCLYNRPAINAALKLVREQVINPAEVDEVTVSLFRGGSHQILSRPFEIGSDPHMDANWSTPYNVANVLLRGGVRLEHVTDDFVRDPEVLDLARRVKVVELPPPRTARVDIKVVMKGGKELSTSLDDPMETTQEPLDMDSVKEKFRNNVVFSKAVSPENAERALDRLQRLENMDNVAEIFRLLGLNV